MVVHQNRREAHEIVDRGMDEIEQEGGEFLTTPLPQIGVSTRTANSFEEFGVITIGDFLNADIGGLLAIPEMGETSVLNAMQVVLGHAAGLVLESERKP